MKYVLTTATVALLAMGSAAFAASGSSGASNNDTSRSNLGTSATEGGQMKNPGAAGTQATQPYAPQNGTMSSGSTGTAPVTSGEGRPGRDPLEGFGQVSTQHPAAVRIWIRIRPSRRCGSSPAVPIEEAILDMTLFNQPPRIT